MRWRALLREIWATTWSTRIPSALITLVVAAMCFTAIATVGRSAAAAADVAARMEQAGARRLSVVDARSVGFINPRTLAGIRSLSTVEETDALGAPFDATNGVIGFGGTQIPVWPVLGKAAGVGDLVWGRAPQPGEAVISITALPTVGMAAPVGYLVATSGEQYPVVGAYRARPPFEDLAAGAIVVPEAPVAGREVRVLVSSIGAARETTSAVLSILAAPADADGVYVDAPTALAETARDIDAQLSGAGRSLLMLILVVGGVFVAAVVLADVLIRRRDLGRRRTLGITRSRLTALVAGRAVLTATLGALIGCVGGAVFNASLGAPTPWMFVVGVGVLALLAAGLAAIAPAAAAARLDPVTVMRTP